MSPSALPVQTHPIITTYKISSNDVLDGELRINVLDESTGRIAYYKDRQLVGEEILGGVYETSQKSTALRWLVHRPTRGWYIRLRAPNFPPGVYINLSPCQAESGSLEFSCRSGVWPQPTEGAGTNLPVCASPPLPFVAVPSDHTYPPPRSPSPSVSSTSVTSAATPPPPFSSLPPPQYQITKFILRPATQIIGRSLISRTLAKFRRTISFILSPTPPQGAEGLVQAQAQFETVTNGQELGPLQLLSFAEDSHSSISKSSGTLIINEGLAAQLGVDVAFWVAVTLAYWEYLGERESYILSADG